MLGSQLSGFGKLSVSTLISLLGMASNKNCEAPVVRDRDIGNKQCST